MIFGSDHRIGAPVGTLLLSSQEKGHNPPSPIPDLRRGALVQRETLSILIGQTVPGFSGVAFANQVSRLGLSCVPSSLLATILAFDAESEIPIADRLKRYLSGSPKDQS